MSERFAAGSMISHYRIVSRLGAGGMGEVFKAQDITLDRPVALKILPPDLVRNEDRVRRFVQEAKAASSLSHPHIVAIHEVGEMPLDADGTTRYIVMEFVNGVTLRTKIHDVHASLKELLEYLAQTADGLAKAHAAGIVHRDLKPDNIMVTQDGYAKVLDFGLAKLVEKRLPSSGSGSRTAMKEQTHEGVVLGTLGYMSPEQVRGQSVDHRSDIFSFGCILYEAVTKQKPFVADSDIDVLHKIVHDEPASVSEVNPKAPAEVRRMIRRCLAKDPEKRYQSMKDVAIELRDLSQEFDTLGSQSGPSAPVAALPTPRRWIPAALAIVGVASLIAALVLRREAATPTAAAPMEAKATQLTSQAGTETQPKISPDGRYVVYVGHAAGNLDIYLQRLGGMNAINLTASSIVDDSQPAFSPDGQLIAFRSERQGGGIFVMGATGESVRRVTDVGFFPTWSPDGKELVYSTANFTDPLSRGTTGELWRVEVETQKKRKIAEADAVQPSWSPQGTRIAYWAITTEGGGTRDIFTVPAAGGQRLAVTNDVPADWNPIWAPDGKHLYFISNRGGTMNLWRVGIDEKTGTSSGVPEPVTTPARNIGYIDFTSDGKKFVFAAIDIRSDIERLSFDPRTEIATGPPVPVVRGSLRAVQCDVSPDGQWIAFRTEGEEEDLYAVRSDGSEFRKLTDDIARDRAPDWSSDGTRIAFYSDRSGRYEVWSIRSDGSGLQQITSMTGPSAWFPRWSPDGHRMSIHNALGTFLFSIDGALPVTKVEPLPPFSKESTFRALSWSPDGKWLAGNETKAGSSTGLAVILYSLEGRQYKKLTNSGGSPSWLSDSRRLLYRDAGLIMLVDRETGRIRKIAELEERLVFGTSSVVVTSSDNRSLYYTRSSSESDIWLLSLK